MFGFKKSPQAAHIIYRVVFVSPFFELEVKCLGGRWQTVHSQKGQPHGTDPHVTIYPMLKFSSFPDATTYAKDVLGLSVMDKGALFDSLGTSFFGLLSSPPASHMQEEARKPAPVSDSFVMSAAKMELVGGANSGFNENHIKVDSEELLMKINKAEQETDSAYVRTDQRQGMLIAGGSFPERELAL